MENHFQVDTLYNLFIERYLQNLSLYSVPVNTTCGIHISEIKGTLKGCKLKIINLCIDDKELSFYLLIKTFKEFANTLSQNEKYELANEVGIDLDNQDKNYIPEIIRKCTSTSTVTNVIDIQTFDIGECIAPNGKNILLQIINSGTSEANCVMNTIMKSMSNRYTINNYIDNRIPFINDVHWFIFFVLIIFIIFLLGLCSIKRKINIKYKYGSFLYV
ncbi:S-S bond formation pathway protein [Goatpox virus Pellor]|uniref:S-S bond formation pathway protein n=1 Tax=Goatpox virus TaxID=186805 RepID=A0A1B2LPJ7_9POXV|nr:S-S bond formation pathway protein [Goatpox virus Pellor]AOA32982.1 S-S bond formation pathway protein [Goatpox virus]